MEIVRLKKNEDRRLRAGHVWVYSNEIDTTFSPLKNFSPGEEVRVEACDKSFLGIGYINPHSLITVRIISRNPKELFNEELILKRMQQALIWREKYFNKPFYRFVFGESDGLPGLVVDRFGNHFALQLNTAGMDNKKNEIVSVIKTLITSTESILFRNDSSSRTLEGLEKYVDVAYGTPPQIISLEENETIFNAPFWEGQKTGWFYDHRMNRSRLKSYVKEKSVLDVFSYLGGWGIQARHMGACEVTCLDASAIACEFILKNAALNSLKEKVSVICDDAFVGLKNLLQANKKFDVIILDPPAFVKKQKDKKEGLIAYQRINELALKLLTSEGILISCSCSMHVEYADLLNIIRRAALNTNNDLQIIERGHQAQDHPIHLAIPETDYLKMIIARKI